jgi:uncharacterized protein
MRWLLLVALLSLAPARAEVPVPPLSGRVVDLTQTLAPAQAGELETLLEGFERRKGSQIAVLVVPTTAPEPIEAYAIRVAEAWKIGRAGIDDGVIVLVAREDRSMRLEVGYGLEGTVPDAVARRLIEEHFLPGFRAGDYYAGLSAGLAALIDVIDGEPLPQPAAAAAPDGRAVGQYFPLFLFLVFAGGGLLRAMLGRIGGAGAVAAVAGVAGWLIAGSLLIALLLAIAGFVLTLFGGIGGIGRRGGGRGWGGSPGGGGFRGGGGGFGGGGASGRW